MQDRIPTYPGRVILTPVAGQSNKYDMERADEPTQAGDPLNKATLLTDSVAASYGLSAASVPNNVFAKIRSLFDTKVELEVISYTGTGTYGPNNPTSVTFSKAPSVVIMLGHKNASGDRWYQHLDLDYDNVYMLPASAVPTSYTRGFGFGQERNYDIYGKKSSDGKTFSWYSWDSAMGEGDEYDQCNESGYVYYILGLSTGATSTGRSSGDSSRSSGGGTITFTIDGVGTYNCTSGTTWADWEATSVGSSVIYIDHDDLVWLSSGEVLCDSSGTEQYASYPIIDGGIYMGGGSTE